MKNIERKIEPYHPDNTKMHNLDHTIKTFMEKDKRKASA